MNTNKKSPIKIGIVCAGDKELAPFLPVIDNCRIIERAKQRFYTGQIDGVEIVALVSGICRIPYYFEFCLRYSPGDRLNS